MCVMTLGNVVGVNENIRHASRLETFYFFLYS